MDVAWSSLFLAGKWLFIGLVYLALFVVLVAVRREMHLRVANKLQAPAVAAGRLKVVEAGSDPKMQPGAFLPLPNEATLGADPKNEVVLADRFVSGRHARLYWDGVEWWVEDLGSKNGVFVNGQRCPPQRRQPLPFGATLRVGDMVFEVVE